MLYKKTFIILFIFFQFCSALSMDENTKFFFVHDKKKYEVTRAGLEKSKKIKEIVDEVERQIKDKDNGDDPDWIIKRKRSSFFHDEMIGEFYIYFDNYPLLGGYGEKMVKLFADISSDESKVAGQKTDKLIHIVRIADILHNDNILKECALEFKKKISTVDYIKFLKNKGLLWKLIENAPKNFLDYILKPELFPDADQLKKLLEGLDVFPRGRPFFLLPNGDVFTAVQGEGAIFAILLPGGKAAVVNRGKDNVVEIINWKNKEIVAKRKTKSFTSVEVWAVAPNGDLVVFSGIRNLEYYLERWDDNPTNYTVFSVKFEADNTVPFKYLHILPDGNIVAGARSGLQLRDGKTGMLKAWLFLQDSYISLVHVCPDGTLLVGFRSGAVSMWKANQLVSSKSPIRPSKIFRGGKINLGSVSDLLCFFDNRLVSAHDNSIICLWDIKTGRLISKNGEGGGKYEEVFLNLAPTGDVISSARGKTVCIWNLEENKKIAEFKDTGSKCMFLPDSRLICHLERYGVRDTLKREPIRYVPTGLYDQFSFQQAVLIKALQMNYLQFWAKKSVLKKVKKIFKKNRPEPFKIIENKEIFDIFATLPIRAIKTMWQVKQWVAMSEKDMQDMIKEQKQFVKEDKQIKILEMILKNLTTSEKDFSSDDITDQKEKAETIFKSIKTVEAKRYAETLLTQIKQNADLAMLIWVFRMSSNEILQRKQEKKSAENMEKAFKEITEHPYRTMMMVEELKKILKRARAELRDEEEEGEVEEDD